MAYYSSSKDLRKHIAGLVKEGWTYKKGGKHGKLIAPNGRKMAVPVSPSGANTLVNQVHQARRIAAMPAGSHRKQKRS
ncbi:hypothetical protein K6W76_21390 [Burkholderia anthina]|uniref:hypothetical protein n=1 Tax=Burkholderia anthina TaxID=179879 RepID=UPI0015889117|nr:hypothetical protein [Burkholderia anthina]MBY4869035.1 hypothetical protein [Burkholderia anthina]